ncbi:MAG: Smr/MutS family protein [Methylorubrum populi]
MRERAPRRPRRLSREEAHLWGEIAKLITPLRGRAEPKKAPPAEIERPAAPARPDPAAAVPPSARPIPKPVAKPAAKPPTKPPAKPVAPPAPRAVPAVGLPRAAAKPLKLGDLAPEIARVSKASAPLPPPSPPGAPGLERRERRGLERGTLSIEARIDLHGLYQAEAHAALVGFLLRARAAGHARVLVVTGKGGEDFGERGGFAQRGVLRRSVPHWLRGPELRGLVLGFEAAARHHGGAGALYVRLRRR